MKGLPPRPEDGHKGSFGTVGVIGGCDDEGIMMVGAPALAARAALRSGCGRAVIMSPSGVLPSILSVCPSATGCLLRDEQEVIAAFQSEVQALLIGPGLGRSRVASGAISSLLDSNGPPLVMDADAIHLYAALGCPRASRCMIWTPHPGEAMVLAQALGIVDQAPLTLAAALAEAIGGVVVLKGHRTVVAGESIWQCQEGGVELAVPGSGDVLAGIIASLVAQQVASDGLDPEAAAKIAVLAHARAGASWAAAHQVRGMMAMELADRVGGHLESVASELDAGAC